MKLKFKNQEYQNAAVSAVADLFTGQEKSSGSFTVMRENPMSFLQNEFGIGNAMLIDEKTMIDNLHTVQKRFRLPLTQPEQQPAACQNAPNFCVEMETGTGKTYVYIKTIFELHKRYGFTKFIIVVPSVAIREGVYKSFEITKEHFGILYDNVPCRYFIYNSARLSDVRQFATSSNIEIMIINIDAFKKEDTIINQPQDRLNGETAMRYIQATNPIVIIDEPQSVDNTPKAKEAIASLNPLCVLRYSATHREKINTVFRLTPVDAYQMGLVKQICVASVTVENDFNKPYIRLENVTQEGGFKAKIEIDVRGKDGRVSRKRITVKPDSDLYFLSGKREMYEGYIIAGIDCTPGAELIEFANTEILRVGRSMGDVDDNLIKREQIHKTIEIHLDKELLLNGRGVKVLSLFFIDRVEKYRTETGGQGIYAKMFEECYNELINKPKYSELKKKYENAGCSHNGYFSRDKKGTYKNTKGDTIADYDTYNTIMKDKEWLLSFDCPLRFIFSHSALKEGWDNPNVFQVCTLVDQKSLFTCRQKIGRGLRLCVNQDGERIEDKNVNLLHVIANESFAEFADTLQKEIETETGMKFGVLEISLFSGMVYEERKIIEKIITPEQAEKMIQSAQIITQTEEAPVEAIKRELKEQPEKLTKAASEVLGGNNCELRIVNSELKTVETVIEEKTISYDEAKEIVEHFESKGYISKSGKIKDTLKNALLTGTLDLPAKYQSAKERFERIIKKADSSPPVRDASRDVIVRLKKQATVSPEFMELWNRIRQKTTYRVKINENKLTEKCIKEFKELPPIPKMLLVSQTAGLNIADSGITHTAQELRTRAIKNDYTVLPDILSIVSEQTCVSRRIVLDIMRQSGRLAEFIRNPQSYIEKLTEVIKSNCSQLDIDGISYKKIDGENYFVQEVFEANELMANLDKNAVAVNRSVYDYVIYDSDTVERPFAIALDNDPDVKLFFKIPERFKIETPVGTYNPDWAIYLEKNGEEKLYFVLETKGSTNLHDLRTKEQLKIHCGKEHFKALDDGIELQIVRDWRDFKKNV